MHAKLKEPQSLFLRETNLSQILRSDLLKFTLLVNNRMKVRAQVTWLTPIQGSSYYAQRPYMQGHREPKSKIWAKLCSTSAWQETDFTVWFLLSTKMFSEIFPSNIRNKIFCTPRLLKYLHAVPSKRICQRKTMKASTDTGSNWDGATQQRHRIYSRSLWREVHVRPAPVSCCLVRSQVSVMFCILYKSGIGKQEALFHLGKQLGNFLWSLFKFCLSVLVPIRCCRTQKQNFSRKHLIECPHAFNPARIIHGSKPIRRDLDLKIITRMTREGELCHMLARSGNRSRIFPHDLTASTPKDSGKIQVVVNFFVYFLFHDWLQTAMTLYKIQVQL